MTPHPATDTLNIAQGAPLWESVPPQAYGGIESFVSLLTESLVHRGHHVTLFAAGTSQTEAHLEAGCPSPLRTGAREDDYHIFQDPSTASGLSTTPPV